MSKLCASVDILVIKKNNNLAGINVTLPSQNNDFQQYHSEYYIRFTALTAKYRVSKTV